MMNARPDDVSGTSRTAPREKMSAKKLEQLFQELQASAENCHKFLEEKGLSADEKNILAYLNCLATDSRHTRAVYIRYICDCLTTVGKTATEVLESDLENYIQYLVHERHVAPATISTAIGAIRSLYRWMTQCGILRSNPAASLKISKIAAAERVAGIAAKSLTFDEVAKVLAHLHQEIRRQHNSKGAVRDLALFYLLARAGLCVSEACRLTWRDFYISRGRWVLNIPGKGLKRRIIFLPAEGAYSLLDVRAVFFGIARHVSFHGKELDPLPLFPRLKGDPTKPMTGNNINRIIAGIGRELKDVRRFSPNGLRHTCLTHLFQLNAPLESIRTMAGHETPSTTRLYKNAGKIIAESALAFENRHSTL